MKPVTIQEDSEIHKSMTKLTNKTRVFITAKLKKKAQDV